MRGGREAVGFARGLRGRMTPAEVVLWGGLRQERLGVRFRRQHPVPPFTLDFACVALRLAVEVDGETHAGGDAGRDGALAARGWRVVRFSNAEVLGNLAGVLARIGEILGEMGARVTPPSGSPRKHGGGEKILGDAGPGARPPAGAGAAPCPALPFPYFRRSWLTSRTAPRAAEVVSAA
jgi:very-short-patch-repair endonuclease